MKSKCGDTGFTLIEVALSIAVLALGVLALYTLLSTALDTSAKAKADSQAAMFADGVFNTLRAQSMLAAEQEITTPGSWVIFWNSFSSGNSDMPVAFAEAWSGNMTIKNGGPYTCIFVNAGGGGATNIVNNSLRYTITSQLEPSQYRADVVLKVWGGQFGPTDDASAQVFYSEFRKEGDL